MQTRISSIPGVTPLSPPSLPSASASKAESLALRGKRVKTSSNKVLDGVLVPTKLRTTIDAHGTEWLWQGGVFSLPLMAKEQLYKDAQNKLEVYLKAKLMVINFYFYK
jgi:hypothetical protein